MTGPIGSGFLFLLQLKRLKVRGSVSSGKTGPVTNTLRRCVRCLSDGQYQTILLPVLFPTIGKLQGMHLGGSGFITPPK